MSRRVTIKDMQDRIDDLNRRWKDCDDRRKEEITILKAELERVGRDANENAHRLYRTKELWNRWIEADKGSETELAFVRFDPETFQSILSLLHP